MRRTRLTTAQSIPAKALREWPTQVLVVILLITVSIVTGMVMYLPHDSFATPHTKAPVGSWQVARMSEGDTIAKLSPDPVDVPHFTTQPAIGIFANGGGGYTSAQCAAALDANSSSYIYNDHPINQETVPQNQQPHPPGSSATGFTSPVNQTKPNASQLAYYASDGYRSSEMDPPYTWMKLVDGQYTGTTEMIIRWAACKWGMDED